MCGLTPTRIDNLRIVATTVMRWFRMGGALVLMWRTFSQPSGFPSRSKLSKGAVGRLDY